MHHKTLAPSMLPMLNKCPCFERNDSATNEYIDNGINRHEIFSRSMITCICPEDDGVAWAYHEVEKRVRLEYGNELCDTERIVESVLTVVDDDFNVITYGTPDLIIGSILFDLKSRERDYSAQLAAYARGHMHRAGLDKMLIVKLLS